MADDSELEFPKCSTLFLTEDGSPILFYMTPSTMKTKLRPLIHVSDSWMSCQTNDEKYFAEPKLSKHYLELDSKFANGGEDFRTTPFINFTCICHTSPVPKTHGGGELSSKVLPDSIKLVDPTSGGTCNMAGYLSTDYIFDSIKHGKLEDMEKYRLKSSSGNNIKNSKSQKKNSTSKVKVSGSTGGGRNFYTRQEDLALLSFVNENKAFHSIKGNSLYKEAAKAKVTSHTWQSMRDHYLKVLWNRKKIGDLKKLIFKDQKEGSAVVLKRKVFIDQADISRRTRSQTASPKKILNSDNRHSEEQDLVTDISRRTRSQTASPKKTLNSDNRDSEEQDLVTDNSRVASDDSENDGSTVGEDVDYDKMFDDNLLRLAAESKAGKDHRKVNDDEKVENKVLLSQDSQKSGKTEGQEEMNERLPLSDFDGEVSTKEALKRASADEDEEKRPIAKRSKGNLASSPDKSELSKSEKLSKRYQDMQSNLERLESLWTVPQIIHALLVTSGKLDDAETYLQNGEAGKEHWSLEEDKILLSKNKEAISDLARKRGLQSVVNRMNFIEGISST